jgi:ribonuclease Z
MKTFPRMQPGDRAKHLPAPGAQAASEIISQRWYASIGIDFTAQQTEDSCPAARNQEALAMMKHRHGMRPIISWMLVLPFIFPLRLAPQGQNNRKAKTQIVLLGTGTPNAEPERSGTATAIVVNGTAYLVNFGPGVIRRAAAAGLDVTKLSRAFVTHLHSDHTAGYPDLILTPWVLGRNEPLEVYGPRGIRAMTEHILAAYQQDIAIRTHGLEPANPIGYKVNVHEIQPGIIYKDANVRVKAFRVTHGSWPDAFGYRLETPDRTIVISGDTTPNPILVENARGCEVLIHEVYAQAGFAQRPPEWQRYHSQFHTSSVELAKMAAQAKPGLLILTHVFLWSSTEDQLLHEINGAYAGKVVVGSDLKVY